ncbi:unnamed protein product [Schistosoma margrebowiei]|uniref:Uncharacterized protein n=1 Tax=Schistosoma margrebowiei TaxID=48269 RepID=A0A183MYD9_9TREM|nr:unnamed protein product [Schistosoma margrebowiei]
MCKPYCEKLYPVQELFLTNFDSAIIRSVKSWLVHVIDTEKTEKEQRFVVRRGVDTTLDKFLDQRYGDVMYAIVGCGNHNHASSSRSLTNSHTKHTSGIPICCGDRFLCAFAMAAKHMEWTRPKIVNENCIHIYKGWYPIQQTVSTNIIKNSFYSDGSKHKITLLTGPNGSGKSIYMKNIALIIYLTHIGSYIPAEGATISAFDAIHILTGTNSTERDNCSTYMKALQMASVALRNLTSKTLIIMDEFAKSVNKLELDALTLAMAEFLLLKNDCPYTIIATHNHTILRQLQMYGPQVQYLTMRTVPHEGRVVCLYEAVNGLNLRSEAISTATATGLPKKITERALTLKDFLSTIPTHRMKNRNKKVKTVLKLVYGTDTGGSEMTLDKIFNSEFYELLESLD